jgi:5,10-methylenetetrahydromethanopterin reductase
MSIGATTKGGTNVRGLGAELGIALWGTEPVPRLVRQARLAEELGFESVWVIDSQLLCRDVFVTLAACLAGTSRIKVATGVTNPITRHVSATAGALATLDEMYPGRVLAGVGSGFSSLRTIGLAGARLAQLERFTSALRGLLHGEPRVFANGVSGAIGWRSENAANVPVMMAASGPKVTHLASRIADGAILLQGIAPDLIDRALEWIAAGKAGRDRPDTDFSVTCWAPLGLGATSEMGCERVRARVASSLMQGQLESFLPGDRDAVAALRARYDSFDHAAAAPPHSSLVPDRLIRRYAIAGNAGDVRHQLETLARRPGIDRIVFTAQGGGIPLEDTLEALGRDVLAALP